AVLRLRQELAIGYDAPLLVDGSLDLPAESADTVREDDAIRGAIERRAELKAASAEREGAKLATRAARAQRLPSVSLYADQGTTGRETDRLLGTYSYGVQLSMPMFDGMRIASQTSEQRARQREADASLQDTRRRIETEVRSAVLTLAASREEVAAASVRLRLAEQEVAQARERFRAGVSSNAEVITALIALNGARDLVIDALTSYHAARVSLASAQGTTTALP
ncbi:MAG TPA: TolC family protein, partial [Gemmatimonadaceae bacterium]|nr:TolC family protein [Gemmatimonadaceae bacterium]